MTAAAAAMFALMLARPSWKTALAGSLVMLLMGAARCYLVAHYPSDVLAALVVGALAALVAQIVVTRAFSAFDARARRSASNAKA